MAAWVRWCMPVLVVTASCSQRSQDNAPRSLELTTAEAGIPDAGPAKELELSLWVGLDGGTTLVRLEPNAKVELEPTDALALKSNIPLRNYRIRIFDESDRALVSDDRSSESEQGIDYRIQLATPLKPGHRYAVVLDAESGVSFMDSNGKPYSDIRTELRVLGAREKSPPKKAKPGRKRKR